MKRFRHFIIEVSGDNAPNKFLARRPNLNMVMTNPDFGKPEPYHSNVPQSYGVGQTSSSKRTVPNPDTKPADVPQSEGGKKITLPKNDAVQKPVIKPGKEGIEKDDMNPQKAIPPDPEKINPPKLSPDIPTSSSERTEGGKSRRSEFGGMAFYGPHELRGR